MREIIVLDKVPENCRDCPYKTVYYARELEEDNYTRPKSCPIIEDTLKTIPENEIAQLADQISRVHLISVQELKQRGLLHD